MVEDYAKHYYPAYLDLTQRLCVVIGGGAVAERKVKTLLRYGGDVYVIAPDLTERLEGLEERTEITAERRGYVRGDLAGAALVICATDSPEVTRAVFEEAVAEGCLVNVVDVPELCNFIVPSVVRRGQFQVAISTGGAAPAVAKRVRRRLAEEFGDEWGDYVDLLGRVRTVVMEHVTDERTRKAMFEKMADSDLLARIAAGERPRPEDVFAEFLREATREEDE
jgi:precorrin-2 dehydrogenase/sirohydrochlorin ferrochelatase